jgi:predicted RNA-binding protein YlqC (UPF0109 family)
LVVDERQRAGLMIVVLVYLVGYLIGRAGGQADAARRVIEGYAGARSA